MKQRSRTLAEIAGLVRLIGGFLLGYLGLQVAAFVVPGWGGLVVAALLAIAFVLGFLVRTGRPAELPRRRATLRLRLPTPQVWVWTLVAIPVLLALSWSVGQLYEAIVPLPADAWNQLEGLTDTPQGRRLAVLLAAGVAPVVEEFFFRGLLQRPLERRWGARRAVAFTALIFALVHPAPWLYPVLFFLGLAFGAVVVASRSIWPAVLLHTANNALALLGIDRGETPKADPAFWQPGFGPEHLRELVAALAMLALAAPAAWVVLRGMQRASRRGSGTLPPGPQSGAGQPARIAS